MAHYPFALIVLAVIFGPPLGISLVAYAYRALVRFCRWVVPFARSWYQDMSDLVNEIFRR